MLFFGNHWHGKEPYSEIVATPVGQGCAWCEEPIGPQDDGVIMGSVNADGTSLTIVFHHECEARSVLGSLGHQQQLCSCYGGTIEDPPELTRRQAAAAALAYARRRMR